MKTIYIFKSPSNNIGFGCNETAGLHFIESAIDMSHVHNIVINQKLKIQVQQTVYSDRITRATLWFIYIGERSTENKDLEAVYGYIKNIGNQLYRVTRLGQHFSYKNIYYVPNVSDHWNIENVRVEFNSVGDFERVIWVDKSKEIEEVDGEKFYQSEGKIIKPDFGFAVGSDNQQTQCQFVHLTIPSTNVQIDSSGLRVDGTLDNLSFKDEVSSSVGGTGFILELFNNAITTDSIFTSYILLYQIVEVIIDSAESTKLDSDSIDSVMDAVAADGTLSEQFRSRVKGMLKGLKSQTSKELLEVGIKSLVGEAALQKYDFSSLSKWRGFRGRLTHPKDIQPITDTEFVESYNSIRFFVDQIIQDILDCGA